MLNSLFKNKAFSIFLGLILAGFAIFLFLKPSPPSPEKTIFTIYFSQSKGSDTVVSPVKREFLTDANNVLIEDRIRWAVKELLNGPTAEETEKGFYSEIPKGTEVKKVYAKDKELVLELTGPFAEGGGASSITQRLLELQETVEAVPGNTYPVHLKLNGQKVDVLGSDGLEVADPFAHGNSK